MSLRHAVCPSLLLAHPVSARQGAPDAELVDQLVAVATHDSAEAAARSG